MIEVDVDDAGILSRLLPFALGLHVAGAEDLHLQPGAAILDPDVRVVVAADWDAPVDHSPCHFLVLGVGERQAGVCTPIGFCIVLKIVSQE